MIGNRRMDFYAKVWGALWPLLIMTALIGMVVNMLGHPVDDENIVVDSIATEKEKVYREINRGLLDTLFSCDSSLADAVFELTRER